MSTKLSGVELRHLRYFNAVARHLSFSRASDELRVAQPALSRQIKDLEDYLEVQLFDRSRMRVRLTPAGLALKAQAERILAQIDIAVTAVRHAAKEKSEEFVIGNDWRLSHPLVTRAVMLMRERFPTLDVELQDLTMPEQITALKEGRIEVGFLPSSRVALGEKLLGVPFTEGKLFAVVGTTHRLANAKRLKMKDLRDEQWLVIDGSDAHGYRSFLTRLCKEFCGFFPRRMKGARSREAMLNLAAVGEGICIVMDHMAPRDNPMLKSIPIEGLKPVELCAVHQVPVRSKALQAFLSILQELRVK